MTPASPTTAPSSWSTPRTSASCASRADGTWLGELNTPARYFLGGTFKGNLFYLADIGRHVRVFDTAGNQVNVIDEVPGSSCADLFDIRDATADSAGNIYVANYRQNAINVFSPTGECLHSFGSTGTGDGQFKTPYGVATAVDPVSGHELLYVADAQNNRVQVFELDGTFVGQVRHRRAAPTSRARSTRCGGWPWPTTAAATCGWPTCGAAARRALGPHGHRLRLDLRLDHGRRHR